MRERGNQPEPEKGQERVFEHPEVVSYTTIEFRMPEHEGVEQKPGERFVFSVPAEYKNRVIRDVILRHRKAEKYRKDIGPDGYDPHGAYSKVEVQDAGSGEWRGWRDPAGYDPVKFAEPRSAGDPEVEVLHDWVATVGEIRPSAVRVTNVGQDPVYSTANIHGLEIVFFPELEGVSWNERIYTPGTSFVDFEKRRVPPEYGGGEHTGGIYEHAVALGGWGGSRPFETAKDAGPGARIEGSRLVIDLEDGKALAQAEVSVGDTEFRSHGNPRLGWAKLWVGIRRAASQEVEWFIKNANIPPQGVISGGPHLERAAIGPGDQLVIESRADAAYIMGWRVAYRAQEEKQPQKMAA